MPTLKTLIHIIRKFGPNVFIYIYMYTVSCLNVMNVGMSNGSAGQLHVLESLLSHSQVLNKYRVTQHFCWINNMKYPIVGILCFNCIPRKV